MLSDKLDILPKREAKYPEPDGELLCEVSIPNRESGFGRFDIQLEPIDSELPGFIFELKFDRNNDADLNVLLEEATKQIEARRYDADMRSRGVKEIVSLGIAFAGKRVKIRQV